MCVEEVGSIVKNRECLLYTYEAADEEDRVDLSGSSIIKTKNTEKLLHKV